MRRGALLLATSVLLILSCSREESADVVLWQFQRPDIMESLIEEFERQNPQIDVEFETLTWQSGYEKIVMAFSSGTVPDLLEVGSTWLPKFQEEGAVEDITAVTGDLANGLMMWSL